MATGYTLGTTAQLIKQFSKVSDLGLTICYATTSKLDSRVRSFDSVTKQLDKQLNKVSDLIAIMGQSRDTERIASTYQQRLLPLTDSANNLKTEKAALRAELENLITMQEKSFASTILNPEIPRNQELIQKRIEKFDINANALYDRLDSFAIEIKKIMIAAGVSPESTTPTYGSG